MPQTTRTFIALHFPATVVDKLARLQSLLAPDAAGMRWVEPKRLHLTLAFLGDVDHTDLNSVCKGIARAAGEVPPFDLRIEGVGVFGDPRRPRTIWTGCTGPGVDTLLALQARIADAAAAADWPADEKKKFNPHITLGRSTPGRPPADLTRLLNHYRTWSAGSFHVGEVLTMGSTLTPDGPEYTTLARAPLRGGKPQPSA